MVFSLQLLENNVVVKLNNSCVYIKIIYALTIESCQWRWVNWYSQKASVRKMREIQAVVNSWRRLYYSTLRFTYIRFEFAIRFRRAGLEATHSARVSERSVVQHLSLQSLQLRLLQHCLQPQRLMEASVSWNLITQRTARWSRIVKRIEL